MPTFCRQLTQFCRWLCDSQLCIDSYELSEASGEWFGTNSYEHSTLEMLMCNWVLGSVIYKWVEIAKHPWESLLVSSWLHMTRSYEYCRSYGFMLTAYEISKKLVYCGTNTIIVIDILISWDSYVYVVGQFSLGGSSSFISLWQGHYYYFASSS